MAFQKLGKVGYLRFRLRVGQIVTLCLNTIAMQFVDPQDAPDIRFHPEVR
ncbi:hypothetical protein SDC9_90858 [bioreactor metagenome]|uniref:Uncharacterized protein n=1 Tax=bioreactor metagenome TaxID=1076179 RepID=A0A644ZT72_9ZZZZ